MRIITIRIQQIGARSGTRTHTDGCLRPIPLPLGYPSLLYRWCWGWDSNPRPLDYKSNALPLELPQHIGLWWPPRDSNPHWHDPKSCASPSWARGPNALGGIRTPTEMILSHAPLPFGLPELIGLWWLPWDSNPDFTDFESVASACWARKP